jgi:hypothetical protein
VASTPSLRYGERAMNRVTRVDYQGPPPSEAEDRLARPNARSGAGEVRMASDEDVSAAIKRITRDHEELIKALAK